MIFKFVSMPLQSDTFDIKCIGRGADDEVISFDVYDERYTVIDLFGEDVGLINVGDLFFLEHSNTMLNGSWGFVREIEKKKDNSIVNVTLGFHLSGLQYEHKTNLPVFTDLNSYLTDYFEEAFAYISLADMNTAPLSSFRVFTNFINFDPITDIDLIFGDVLTVSDMEKIILRSYDIYIDTPSSSGVYQINEIDYRDLEFDFRYKTHTTPSINLNGLLNYEVIISPKKTAYKVVYTDTDITPNENKTYGVYGLDKNKYFIWYSGGNVDPELQRDKVYTPANIGAYYPEDFSYPPTLEQKEAAEKAIRALIRRTIDDDIITITFDLNNYIYKNAILSQANIFNNLGNRVNVMFEGKMYPTRIKEISVKSNICTITFGLVNVKLFDRIKIDRINLDRRTRIDRH